MQRLLYYNEFTNFCLQFAVAEERQEIEDQKNPINRGEATLSPLSSPSSELPYSNSFCNFDSLIENNILNTSLTLTNPASLPSTRSFVALNGNANIESTRSWSPLTRITERPIRYRYSRVAKPFKILWLYYNSRRFIVFPIPTCKISRYSSYTYNFLLPHLTYPLNKF